MNMSTCWKTFCTCAGTELLVCLCLRMCLHERVRALCNRICIGLSVSLSVSLLSLSVLPLVALMSCSGGVTAGSERDEEGSSRVDTSCAGTRHLQLTCGPPGCRRYINHRTGAGGSIRERETTEPAIQRERERGSMYMCARIELAASALCCYMFVHMQCTYLYPV